MLAKINPRFHRGIGSESPLCRAGKVWKSEGCFGEQRLAEWCWVHQIVFVCRFHVCFAPRLFAVLTTETAVLIREPRLPRAVRCHLRKMLGSVCIHACTHTHKHTPSHSCLWVRCIYCSQAYVPLWCASRGYCKVMWFFICLPCCCCSSETELKNNNKLQLQKYWDS